MCQSFTRFGVVSIQQSYDSMCFVLTIHEETLPGRKGRSEAEAVATVATLSKFVFEELQTSELPGPSFLSLYDTVSQKSLKFPVETPLDNKMDKTCFLVPSSAPTLEKLSPPQCHISLTEPGPATGPFTPAYPLQRRVSWSGDMPKSNNLSQNGNELTDVRSNRALSDEPFDGAMARRTSAAGGQKSRTTDPRRAENGTTAIPAAAVSGRQMTATRGDTIERDIKPEKRSQSGQVSLRIVVVLAYVILTCNVPRQLPTVDDRQGVTAHPLSLKSYNVSTSKEASLSSQSRSIPPSRLSCDWYRTEELGKRYLSLVPQADLSREKSSVGPRSQDRDRTTSIQPSAKLSTHSVPPLNQPAVSMSSSPSRVAPCRPPLSPEPAVTKAEKAEPTLLPQPDSGPHRLGRSKSRVLGNEAVECGAMRAAAPEIHREDPVTNSDGAAHRRAEPTPPNSYYPHVKRYPQPPPESSVEPTYPYIVGHESDFNSLRFPSAKGSRGKLGRSSGSVPSLDRIENLIAPPPVSLSTPSRPKSVVRVPSINNSIISSANFIHLFLGSFVKSRATIFQVNPSHGLGSFLHW